MKGGPGGLLTTSIFTPPVQTLHTGAGELDTSNNPWYFTFDYTGDGEDERDTQWFMTNVIPN